MNPGRDTPHKKRKKGRPEERKKKERKKGLWTQH
jgi:endonuclease YncB( thermonuclease family)